MGGKLEGSSFFSSSSSKRRRRPNNDYAKRTKTCSCSHGPKQHLYLALDDWNGGYSIHKLGIDDILDHRAVGGGEHKHNLLEEAAAIRITSPVPGRPMAFAALGTTIFIGTNPRSHEERAPPTLVYDTKAGAVTVGPPVPNKLCDLSSAMAVGETLYALTSVPFPEWSSLQALSWAPTAVRYPQPWDPAMEWSWNTVPSPLPPPYDGIDIVAYALHPDGHTIFMSTGISTRSLDTRNGVWKDLGDWVLPFRGQAFFDANLDAWVGLHHVEDGYVCCCPVVSRRTAATRSPECRILVEKLIHRKEVPKHWACLRGKDTSLTYMGDSSYAFVENILRSEDFKHGSVLHITLFSLRYDHKGDLRTKVRHATRSYQVSKNTPMWGFSHAAFWM